MSTTTGRVRTLLQDGRTRVLYVLAIAVAVFALEPRIVALLGLLQLALWWPAGLGVTGFARLVRKLLPFFILLLLTSALVSGFGPNEQWVRVPLVPFELNRTGIEAAGLMILRILVVVMASQVARSGEPGIFVAGMRRLGVPERVALALDTTLFLLADGRGGQRGGGGGGRGMGGGRGKGAGRDVMGAEGTNPYRALLALLRGNVSPLVDGVAASLERAEDHVRSQAGERDPAFIRDVAVIAGVSLAMLSLKILKILPGLPFAPGHKGILIIPLYFVARALTRTPWGATLTGLTMGVVAFLLGDGKYGVLEILKHVTPGLIVDALFPLVYRPGRATSALVWSLFGLLVATGRFATIVGVLLLVQAPMTTLAVLAPVGAVHLVFGALSGLVTFHLMRTSKLLGNVRELEPDRSTLDSIAVEVPHGRNP